MRMLIVVFEVTFIALLLVIWFTDKSIQTSKNLWVLFFYNFPSQFLIAIVPHEPVVFYFGKFYSPLVVALVAIAGTLPTEILNYSVFKFVYDLKSLDRFKRSKFLNRLVELFNKSPFFALLVAGFTPVPFYPFRFLVVVAHYPVAKYALAVFLSRTPRYYLLAMLGHAIQIPDYWIAIIFFFFLFVTYLPLLQKRIRGKAKLS